MFVRILKIVGVGLIILIAVLLFNTFTFKSKQLDIAAMPAPALEPEAIVRFQNAIKYKTISFADSAMFDSSQFKGFHRYLKSTYPLVHEKLQLTTIKDYSLLYKWGGSDPALAPWVLMAHQDVVPIEEASRSMWTVEPFEGVVKDDFIWGRGTTDDKVNVISIMETVEKLLKENFQPARTIYLAFGHDEEVGGTGARAIADELKRLGVKADLVLDEGGIITLDKVPGMTKPTALIGTSEKGYLSVELKAEKSGGHSSMPEKETALDILSKAIIAVRENPFPASFSPSTVGFMNHVGPEMVFAQRIVFANTWLFEKVVIGIYESSPGGNAIVRTTAVPTIIHAGMKDNVVPTSASAIVNLRLLPGDSSSYVMERLKKVINDDRVSMRVWGTFEAEPTDITSEEGPGYKVVEQTVKKTFDNTVTTPFLMIGGTDSRHMKPISDNIIKFSPIVDPIGFHGIDERVSLDSYKKSLWFFETLLRSAQ